MVKDEVDIVRDWVIYHGSLFGYEKLFIVDNYSTDGTWEVLQEFAGKINMVREPDYTKKGDYMKFFIDHNSVNVEDTLAFPIDIDEFVVYYERGSGDLVFDKEKIIQYIHNLPHAHVYKANYLFPALISPEGFERATAECEYATYIDYGNMAKTFFNTAIYRGPIDHGNHIHTNNYLTTHIHLLHFHARNPKQIEKKARNNIIGLRHPIDIDSLRHNVQHCRTKQGYHHMVNYLKMLEGTYVIDHNPNLDPNQYVNIKSFKQRILDGPF